MAMSSHPKEIFLDNYDPWLYETPHLSGEELWNYIDRRVAEGTAQIIGNRKRGIYFIVLYHTPWRAELHLLSNSKSGAALIRTLKMVQEYLAENTKLRKLEARFSDTRIVALVKRCGWNHEGTLNHSKMESDGTLIEQLLYGYILSRS